MSLANTAWGIVCFTDRENAKVSIGQHFYFQVQVDDLRAIKFTKK
jgi:hypothetical protein